MTEHLHPSLFHEFGLHIFAAYFGLCRSEKVVEHVVYLNADLVLSSPLVNWLFVVKLKHSEVGVKHFELMELN